MGKPAESGRRTTHAKVSWGRWTNRGAALDNSPHRPAYHKARADSDCPRRIEKRSRGWNICTCHSLLLLLFLFLGLPRIVSCGFLALGQRSGPSVVADA